MIVVYFEIGRFFKRVGQTGIDRTTISMFLSLGASAFAIGLCRILIVIADIYKVFSGISHNLENKISLPDGGETSYYSWQAILVDVGNMLKNMGWSLQGYAFILNLYHWFCILGPSLDRMRHPDREASVQQEADLKLKMMYKG